MSAHTLARQLVVAALCAVSLQAQAQPAASTPGTPASAAAAASMAAGEVRKIDKDAGTLTLRHGRIENLDMPGMTMVFKVRDPRMLDGLKLGDKLRFSADRVQGAITITAIEPAK